MNTNAKQFDLVVIGSGSAGATVAYKCRKAGWSVAIVDSRPYGGTCALRGCDPKKVLVGAAELVDWSERMAAMGVTESVKLDWAALMKFKRTFTDPVPANRLKSYQSAGIATYQGWASFRSPNTLQVGDDELTAKHFVIATGAKPTLLPIDGTEHLTTSDQFLELKRLPKQIVFVGGGYISFEFAHVAGRAGAAVTILHTDDRPLRGFDPDLVAQLVDTSRKAGITIEFNQRVQRITKAADGFTVLAGDPAKPQTHSADLVVHGAGRVPELDELNLEAANIKREKRGVVVNEYLQSVSNPNVYAAGDAAATAGLPLTPIAGYEGGIVATNLLKGNTVTPDYSVQPAVVFTIPPLATVGLTEEQAKNADLSYAVRHDDTTGWYSSRRVNLAASSFKVLVEEKTDQILGAHLFGLHAEEVINLFALAMKFKIPASDLKRLSYAYPTSGSDVPYMV